MPFKAPKKKIPYVIIDGQEMGDSTLVIEHLAKTRGIDLDEGLSEKDKALDQAIWAMVDERTYWYGVYDRWLGAGRPVISEAFFGATPSLLRPVFRAFATRAVKKQLWEQGTGRHSADEILEMAKRDIAALAAIVGYGPYVHGGKIRTIDTAVFLIIVNLTHVTVNTPMTQGARAHANLVAYAQRIFDQYFPD
jgi:glutathione S-transferase